MRQLPIWEIHQITRRHVPEYRNITLMTSNLTSQCFGCWKIISHVIWKDWMVTKEWKSCFALKEIRWSVN